MTTEPMDKGLCERVHAQQLFKKDRFGVLADVLVDDFSWDDLTASGVWSFGPVQSNSNMLIDYTIEDEVDK